MSCPYLNRLSVSGAAPDVERLQRSVGTESSLLDFERVLAPPCDAALSELDRIASSSWLGWLRWSAAFWGPTRNVDPSTVELDVAVDGRRATFEFETQWGRPIPLVEHLARQYLDLDFDLISVSVHDRDVRSLLCSGGQRLGDVQLLGRNAIALVTRAGWEAAFETLTAPDT